MLEFLAIFFALRKIGDVMTSDSERKAAEEYAERIAGHDIDSLRYAMKDPIANARADFIAGYEYALKELEQIAREVYRAGWYTAASYEHPAFLEESIFVKAFQDYWQKKTESGEAK